MPNGQEVYVLKILEAFMKIYHAYMILITTHLLIYGIVTKAGSRLGAIEVPMCWQKLALKISTKLFQMNKSG